MVEFDNYKLVDKGVCAAKGFKAGGINVGPARKSVTLL